MEISPLVGQAEGAGEDVGLIDDIDNIQHRHSTPQQDKEAGGRRQEAGGNQVEGVDMHDLSPIAGARQ